MTFDYTIILLQIIVITVIFALLVYGGKYFKKRYEMSLTSTFKNSRFLNPLEYLPDEELTTLKQVFHLIMILFFVFDILYSIFMWRSGIHTFFVLDIIVSVYLAVNIKGRSKKNMLILFALIPFDSMVKLIVSPSSIIPVLGIFHIVIFVYFIKIYYRKFFEYTESNSLGITIMLLFLIVFISFIITIIVEDVTPLDSIVMVSNAFTSNGYAVLGHSGFGKVDALVLVWSGFILSGVGTATLTIAIVTRHMDEKFEHLKKLAEKK